METTPPAALDKKQQLIYLAVFSVLIIVVIPVVANIIIAIKKRREGIVDVPEGEDQKWPFSMKQGKLEIKGNLADIFGKLGLNQLKK